MGQAQRLEALAEQATRSGAINMSILFDSPIPYESISEGRRKEQALGGQLAKSMMDSYFRATSLRAQQEQWAEEAPLREANQTMMAARAEGEKIDSQLKSLKLINETRKKESIAGLAAIQEEAAMSGWNWMSRAGYHEYISKHPELFGSPEAESVERNFDNAEQARAKERQWKAETEARLTIAREREDTRLMLQDAKDSGSFEPPVWEDPKTGKRFAISEGGALVPLTDDAMGVAEPIPDASGKPVPGLYSYKGRPLRVPVDPLATTPFNTSATNQTSVGAAGAASATKVYDYDANGRRIQK